MSKSYFVKDLLKDQVALITGAGTGIGKIIGLELARHGAHIILVSRNAERLEAAAQEIRALGPKALVIPTDISDIKQVKTMSAKAVEEFGHVDCLINNAAANFVRPTEAITSVRWEKVVDIVLNGTFFCTNEIGRKMLQRGSGKIINMVATYAWTGGPGFAPSVSAKAGVVALTQTLGAEWAGRGVLVNAIAPGAINTPQTEEKLWPLPEIQQKLLKSIPLGRFGTEHDVANLILYLASPMGNYIAGEIIVVDGGWWLGKGAMEMMGGAIPERIEKQAARTNS
ncbi:MAG: SDR family oxidoreductase [Elusimicrobia bacterium]|nr:SDR family oxidoreductase [Elusimicrobiota bacterium]